MTSPSTLPELEVYQYLKAQNYDVEIDRFHTVSQVNDFRNCIVERLRFILLKSSDIDEMDDLITKLIAELERKEE